MIPEHLVDFIHGPHGMVLGTRDEKLIPTSSYAFGATADAENDLITLFVPDAYGAQTIRNLEQNGKAALTMGTGLNHEAFQFKGDFVESHAMTEHEIAVLEAGGIYKPQFGERWGLELGYDFSQTLYEDQTSFDLQSHTVSGSVEDEINGFDTGFIYLYSRTKLGGDDFLGLHSLTPTLGYALHDRWYVSLRYNHINKDFIASSNDGRDASLNSGTIDNFLFFMDGKAYVSLGYKAEDENTDDTEFDYFGHFFHAKLKMPIPMKQIEKWNPVFRLGYEYYDKDYSNVTASIGEKRKDERTTVTLGLSADFSKHLFGKFNFEHIEAVSNLSSSDYDENVVTVALGVRY